MYTILITGAGGETAYHFLRYILSGEIFGHDVRIKLHLMDLKRMLPTVKAVVTEIQNCDFKLLDEFLITSEEEEAFKDIDFAILIGGCRQTPSMSRSDLIQANIKSYRLYGIALYKWAKSSTKVVVVADPVNTNLAIVCRYATNIDKKNFTGLIRYELNKAIAQIAARLGFPYNYIHGCLVWGNRSPEICPDAQLSWITIPESGEIISVSGAVNEDSWMKETLKKFVVNREIILGGSNDPYEYKNMAAAKALADHLIDWFRPTPEDEWVNMIVMIDETIREYYNQLTKGFAFSLPVRVLDKEGNWEIVDLHEKLHPWTVISISSNIFELRDEMKLAVEICSEEDVHNEFIL